MNDRVGLEEVFSKEEIREVIFSCEGDKSPGPDKFNLDFIKNCLDVVGEDIIGFIQAFHKSEKLPKAWRIIGQFDKLVACIRLFPSCLLQNIRGRLVRLFQGIKLHLFLEGRFWMGSLLLMKLLIMPLEKRRIICYLSLILLKRTIVWIGSF